jgi:hypothetical protein
VIKVVQKQKSEGRPFNQPHYGATSFKPDFKGHHYKFTILVPIIEKVGYEQKQIFTDQDIIKMNNLFDNDFGGFTSIRKLEGEWMGPKKRIVPNEHMRYEIYTKRNERAMDYFRELKENLEEYKNEEIIVIEQTEVNFMSTLTPKVKSLLRRIRRLERENDFLRAEVKLD